MSEIDRFIATGILCNIAIGDSKKDVLTIMGEPEHFEPSIRSYPAYLLYGSLEVRLKSEKVSYIGLNIDNEISTTKAVELLLDGDYIYKFDDVIVLLSNCNVSYDIDTAFTDDTQMVIVTHKGVHLRFDEDGKLTKIASVSKVQ